MGRQEAPAQLFYDFDLERHVPADHMLREADPLLNGDSLRDALRPFYSHLGRPSIDPELIIRMLVIGYVMERGSSSMSIRSRKEGGGSDNRDQSIGFI